MLGIATLIGACRAQPTPVTLQGDPISIQSLAGDWSGEYWNPSVSRRGAISFSITARADSAFGDVTMAPVGGMIRPADSPDVHRMHASGAQTLRIEFVRVAGGRVAGTLEPYISPDCDCNVSTTFTGTVAGDTIRGTFVTRGGGVEIRQGNWQMVRRK